MDATISPHTNINDSYRSPLRSVLPHKILASLAIYAMVFPLVYLDISTRIYQAIFFRVHGIPMVKRADYFANDRQKLSKLNILQRLNCIYCGYANSMLAWSIAVANQTELYACAIKHETARPGQEHQQAFYEFSQFAEDNRV